MKKARHKYKLGDILEFKFFDGTKKVGEVTKVGYSKNPLQVIDYSTPVYTITVENKNRKLRAKQYNYPSIPHERISCKLDKNHPHRDYEL